MTAVLVAIAILNQVFPKLPETNQGTRTFTQKLRPETDVKTSALSAAHAKNIKGRIPRLIVCCRIWKGPLATQTLQKPDFSIKRLAGCTCGRARPASSGPEST